MSRLVLFLAAACLLGPVLGAKMMDKLGKGDTVPMDMMHKKDLVHKMQMMHDKHVMKKEQMMHKDYVVADDIARADIELIKELEQLVGHLDTEQLKELEDIMEKDLDDRTQFDMITAELKDMGIDDEDIADLKALGVLMNEFLKQVRDIEARLELTGKHDLMDHIQLYLLGLPNKLGPLGYLALHHVLEEDDDADEAEVAVEQVPVTAKTFRRGKAAAAHVPLVKKMTKV